MSIPDLQDAGEVADMMVEEYRTGIDRERAPILRRAFQLREAAKALEKMLMKGRDHRILIRVPDGTGVALRFVDIDIGDALRQYARLIAAPKGC